MTVPTEAYVAALASLPGIGPVGLRRLLGPGDPPAAWAEVVAGRTVRPLRPGTSGVPWDLAARSLDVAAAWHRSVRAGIRVTWAGRPDWPAALDDDPSPPGALFWRGELGALDTTCVAIVGTRRATADGRRTAATMAGELADAGICVVSGLAMGIDGAAHRGALATKRPGATAGVAASGVDRPYPSRHRELWEEVATAGVVLAETPPGHPAQAWRFPARNRIIAGLVDLVVVVESHEQGGSLLTADAAIERGVEVRAVPGAVASPASAGTNQLLWDGPGPVRDATDVLDALGTFTDRPRRAGRRRAAHRRVAPRRAPTLPLDATRDPAPVAAASSAARAPSPPPRSVPGDPDDAAVLEATGYRPTSLNAVVAGAGIDVGAAAAALDRLGAAGLVADEGGWWQRLR